MNRFVLLLKEQPTIIIGLIGAILGLLVNFDVLTFSTTQTGAILGVVSAVLGVLLGIMVRPFQWSVVIGLVQAAVMMLAEFGVTMSEDAEANLFTVVSLIGALVAWFLNTPEVKFEPPAELSPHPRRRAPLIE